jgi:RES domain-containing protein
MSPLAWTPPLSRVEWKPCIRIVPSRYPPINLFERVADPADLDAVHELEGMTNSRLREEVGELKLVAREDRVSGPGMSWVMAPFTHLSAPGGRYSTSTFGAYYAALELNTAVEETKYHRALFLAATSEPPITLDMRVLHANVSGSFHDVRGTSASQPNLYLSSDYNATQALATSLRSEGSWGVVYDSVRRAGGSCIAVWRPPVLSGCKQAQHLAYVWDGSAIIDVHVRRALTP